MFPHHNTVHGARIVKNLGSQKGRAYDVTKLATDLKRVNMEGASSQLPLAPLDNESLEKDVLTSATIDPLENSASRPEVHLDISQLTTSTPKLLEYPPELRERIYGFAVCLPVRIPVRSPHCTSHPLALVNRQLRKEVTPIFFGTNTFHFTFPTYSRINSWVPFVQPERLLHLALDLETSINSWVPFVQPERLLHLALDLETSINSFATLKRMGWQPIRILNEDEYLDDEEKGTEMGVLLGATVVWKPMSRIIEEMATRPKNGRILGMRHLVDAVDERNARVVELTDELELELFGEYI